MAMLFESTEQNVSLHITNLFKEGELEKDVVVKDYLTKVKVEFGLVAVAHNLRKYIALERMRSNAVSSCL